MSQKVLSADIWNINWSVGRQGSRGISSTQMISERIIRPFGCVCGCTCHCCVFPDCLENPKTNENIDESHGTKENTTHNGIYVKILSIPDRFKPGTMPEYSARLCCHRAGWVLSGCSCISQQATVCLAQRGDPLQWRSIRSMHLSVGHCSSFMGHSQTTQIASETTIQRNYSISFYPHSLDPY